MYDLAAFVNRWSVSLVCWRRCYRVVRWRPCPGVMRRVVVINHTHSFAACLGLTRYLIAQVLVVQQVTLNRAFTGAVFPLRVAGSVAAYQILAGVITRRGGSMDFPTRFFTPVIIGRCCPAPPIDTLLQVCF